MKKISAICLISLALLLLFFFIFLFLAVRPDPDDMIISLDVREHSLYYALKMRYLFSSFRTTLILSEAAVMGDNHVSTFSMRLFLYFFVVFLSFVFAIQGLIKKIFMFSPKNWSEKSFLFSIAILLASSAYFLCSSRIEVFGWLGAAGSHFTPMVFVLLGVLILLRKGYSFFADAFLLIICSLMIAGGAEHINAIVIFTNIYLIYKAIMQRELEIERKKILFFAVFHLTCCIFIFTNPGVWHRVQDVNTAQAYGYEPGNFFSMFLQPYKLIGVALAFFAAFLLKQNFKISIPSLSIKIMLGIGLGLFCLCFLMGLIAYHSYDIGRIWFPFDLFLATCVVLIGLKIELRVIFQASLGIVLVLIIMAYNYRHVPALNKFSRGYDAIVEQVINSNAEQEVSVEKFPEPDLVNLVDLSADPNNELNTLFCRFYGSKAKISVQNIYSKSR